MTIEQICLLSTLLSLAFAFFAYRREHAITVSCFIAISNDLTRHSMILDSVIESMPPKTRAKAEEIFEKSRQEHNKKFESSN